MGRPIIRKYRREVLCTQAIRNVQGCFNNFCFKMKPVDWKFMTSFANRCKLFKRRALIACRKYNDLRIGWHYEGVWPKFTGWLVVFISQSSAVHASLPFTELGYQFFCLVKSYSMYLSMIFRIFLLRWSIIYLPHDQRFFVYNSEMKYKYYFLTLKWITLFVYICENICFELHWTVKAGFQRIYISIYCNASFVNPKLNNND